MVLSTLPALRCGFRRSFAAIDFTNTIRAGKPLLAVGAIFVRSTSSLQQAVGDVTWLPCPMRARLQEQLPQRLVVQSHAAA